jgi:hypothetical protein
VRLVIDVEGEKVWRSERTERSQSLTVPSEEYVANLNKKINNFFFFFEVHTNIFLSFSNLVWVIKAEARIGPPHPRISAGGRL